MTTTNTLRRYKKKCEMKTGIERLRQIVNLCNASCEATFDGLSIAEIIKLAEACLNSEWDIHPDDLTDGERKIRYPSRKNASIRLQADERGIAARQEEVRG